MAARYAIYFAPEPGDPLDRFGRRWLGRDACTGEALPRDDFEADDATFVKAITATPRRYGFHATLKAPFRLVDGAEDTDLVDALEALARRQAPVGGSPLELSALGNFLALRPTEACAAIDDLAGTCVRQFDRFRAPADAADLAVRRRGLSDRLSEHLDRWGSPYVLDAFRFHMTLTDALGAVARTRARALLIPRLAFLAGRPLALEALALFVQDLPGADFRAIRRFPLSG